MDTKIHRSKVSGVEWGFILGLLLFIDIIQKILDFFLIGEVINRFADILIGGALLFYLAIRGELSNPQTRDRLVLAFLATFAWEEIPVLDIAAFWTLDGWYCWRLSVETNKLADQQVQQQNEEAQQKKLADQQEKIIRLQVFREAQYQQAETEENELYEEAA